MRVEMSLQNLLGKYKIYRENLWYKSSSICSLNKSRHTQRDK